MKSANLQYPLWVRFDQRRTRETGGKTDILLDSFISLSTPAGSSHRQDVEQIARTASRPFSIIKISRLLDEKKSIRGNTYFGAVGGQIDSIVGNYPGMRWWMEKDGLVVEVVPNDANRLSEFDRKAGKLAYDATRNGRLSKDTLRQIAAKLDAAGFVFSKNLQPAQWRPIREHNKKYPKTAIKTFAAAASDPRFVRSIRRRLYVARDHYRKAYGSVPS